MTDELLNETASETATPVDPSDDVSSAVDEAVRLSREKAEPAPDTTRAVATEAAPKPVADRGDGRTADGRFAPQQPAPQNQVSNVAPATEAQPQPQAPQGLSRGALMRWQRAGFDQFPPAIQAAIAEREAEVDKGFAEWGQKMRAYEGLDKFNDFVANAKTTHAQVMDRAVQWEAATFRDPVGTAAHLLRLRGVDPIAALVAVAGARGVQPQQLAQILSNPQTLAQLRQRAQVRQQAPQPQQQPFTAEQARAVAREEFQRANIETRANDAASQFLSDPKFPHAQNPVVQDAMIRALEDPAIPDLPAAYQKVMGDLSGILAPAASTPPRQQQAVTQARAAAKATVGAPAGGKAPAASAGNPQTLDEAMEMAVAKHRR